MSEAVKTGKAPENAFRVRHLFYLLGAALFVLAVASHHAHDYAVRARGVDGVVMNWIGSLGACISGSLFYFIGLGAYVLAVIVMLAALRPFLPQPLSRQWFWPGVLLTIFGSTLLLALDPGAFAGVCDRLGIGRVDMPELALSGGVIGQALVAPGFQNLAPGALRMFIGTVGSSIAGTILLISGLVMLYRSEWHGVVMGLIDALAVENTTRKTDPAPPEKPAEVPDATPNPAPGASFVERARRLLDKVGRPAAASAEPAEPVASAEPAVPAAPVAAVSPAPAPAVLESAPAGTVASAPAAQSDVSDSVVPAVPAVGMASANSVPAAGTNTAVMPPPPPGLARPHLIDPGGSAPKVRCANYVLPPITMLGKGAEICGESLEAIARNKELLQNTLDSFKIDGQVVGHISGPRVTRYEIRLAPSVKVNKVTEIENNIAMNLKARSLRILAPIPGRDVVGVEVPNTRAEAILMRSVLESEAWQNSNCEIPIVLGKDISGRPVVLDLAKAPHLLIAGATGSGKSVCMNALIMSLLMKFGPDDLRLIMVDPKVVEMAGYQSLPQLITPVIDDFKKVPVALRWAATEMDKRYKLLAKARVRKLKDYNNRKMPDTPVLDDNGLPLPARLPVLIVIIDELADLMMTDARSDIETSISRIAAKGRAAGVHIVVATQRPSRDVITGTIKSNLPTRIAFRVVSVVDSRVILDQKGADALLGMGDMLLLSPNRGAELERIQGALVADEDIEKVVDFVSAQAPQAFDQQVVAEDAADDEDQRGGGRGRNGKNARSSAGETDGGEDEDWSEEDADAFIDAGFETNPMVQKYLEPGDDELIRKALEVVLLEKKASTSYIQRRLKIGYNRAAELIDLMEERGIVGPPSGSGAKRDILVFDDIIKE